MAKKNKKSYNQFSADSTPNVVDMESLSYASDDELKERKAYMLNMKEQTTFANVDTYLWEVELAYIVREIDIRSVRIAMHEKYTKQNPELYNTNSFDFENNSAELN
jgi:hypothetical protein